MDSREYEDATLASLQAGSPSSALVYAALTVATEVRGLKNEMRRERREEGREAL